MNNTKEIKVKYLSNQIFFGIAFLSNILLWLMILNFKIDNNLASFIFVPLCMIVSTLCLHYLFTTVHQASHHLLSKNTFINHIFGFTACLLAGLTFADFVYTHKLHHKHVGDDSLDPDHQISNAPHIFLIPFNVWKHDKHFWSSNTPTTPHKYLKISYITQRILQILIIFILFILPILLTLYTGIQQGNDLFAIIYSIIKSQESLKLSFFWLLPMLTIGILNSMFLFYLPHYTPISKFWSSRFGQYLIELSRGSHHLHHDNPAINSYYYPIEGSIRDMILMKSIKSNTTANSSKYIYH